MKITWVNARAKGKGKWGGCKHAPLCRCPLQDHKISLRQLEDHHTFVYGLAGCQFLHINAEKIRTRPCLLTPYLADRRGKRMKLNLAVGQGWLARLQQSRHIEWMSIDNCAGNQPSRPYHHESNQPTKTFQTHHSLLFCLCRRPGFSGLQKTEVIDRLDKYSSHNVFGFVCLLRVCLKFCPVIKKWLHCTNLRWGCTHTQQPVNIRICYTLTEICPKWCHV